MSLSLLLVLVLVIELTSIGAYSISCYFNFLYLYNDKKLLKNRLSFSLALVLQQTSIEAHIRTNLIVLTNLVIFVQWQYSYDLGLLVNIKLQYIKRSQIVFVTDTGIRTN